MDARVKVVPAQDLWINLPSGKRLVCDWAVIMGHSVVPY